MEREFSLNPALDEVDLAVEAQEYFDLPPCLEPDCSVHPFLFNMAIDVINEQVGG